MTNVVNNFGFMAHIRASLQLFEEFSRGKARTETVLQAMDDGDTIFCMGARAACQHMTHRLKGLGKPNCTAIGFEPTDFFASKFQHKFENALRRTTGKVHLDHRIVFAIIEARLDDAEHYFGQIVGRVGRFNLEVIEQSAYDKQRSAQLPHFDDTASRDSQTKFGSDSNETLSEKERRDDKGR